MKKSVLVLILAALALSVSCQESRMGGLIGPEIENAICDRQLFREVDSSNPRRVVTRDTYWLISFNCEDNTLTVKTILMGNEMHTRTHAVNISFTDQMITLFDDSGRQMSSMTTNDFGTDVLFMKMYSNDVLVLEIDGESSTFIKERARLPESHATTDTD